MTYPIQGLLKKNIFDARRCLLISVHVVSGQCGAHGMLSRETLTEGRVMDLLQGSEYVLTYEDKDSDWMLVGDVPWE